MAHLHRHAIGEVRATWAAQQLPFAMETGWLQPLVVGPDAIPRITDPEQARADPELGVMSALAHGNGDGGEAVVMATFDGLGQLSGDLAMLYHDVVIRRLSVARRRALEVAMKQFGREFSSDFARKYVGEGRHQEAVRLILRQLVRRCGMIGPELQAQLETLDVERLESLAEDLLDFTSVTDLEVWLSPRR